MDSAGPDMTVPSIKLPPGMTIVEDGAGGYEVVGSKESMVRTVAFRTTPSTYAAMLPFIETFPERTWGAAIRWLLEDQRVRTVIAERIGGATKTARRKS